MTGDQGHGPARHPPKPPRRRPGFLPPVEVYEAQSEPPGDPYDLPETPETPETPEEKGASGIWAAATIVAASALLLSAFLPWVTARVTVSAFGQSLSQEVAGEAGVNVDGTGQIVPVLALMAIVMTGWGVLARSPRICALAAAPAVLALISCGLFLVRLDRFRDEIGSGRSGFGALEISTSYGWYLTLSTSLLVIGLSLVGPVARLARRRPRRVHA